MNTIIESICYWVGLSVLLSGGLVVALWAAGQAVKYVVHYPGLMFFEYLRDMLILPQFTWWYVKEKNVPSNRWPLIRFSASGCKHLDESLGKMRRIITSNLNAIPDEDEMDDEFGSRLIEMRDELTDEILKMNRRLQKTYKIYHDAGLVEGSEEEAK